MKLFSKYKPDFESVYNKYSDMLYRIALLYLTSSDDAFDAVHDVFVKFMQNTPQFENENHEKAWFIKTVSNKCKDILRKRKIRNHASLDDVTNIAEMQNSDVSNILAALSLIDEKYKEVIVLHYLEGLSANETAKALGISLSAVKMRLMRGRESLKNILKEEQ